MAFAWKHCKLFDSGSFAELDKLISETFATFCYGAKTFMFWREIFSIFFICFWEWRRSVVGTLQSLQEGEMFETLRLQQNFENFGFSYSILLWILKNC